MAGEMVKYHNDLSDLSLRNFTAAELDILMALCNRLRSKKTAVCKFDFSELRELTKSTEKHDKRFADNIRRTNKKLLELNMMLHDEEHPGRTVQFALFKRFVTDENTQTLEISVNEEFAYILNDLDQEFTRFELEEFVGLKSSYSKACYRQLKRFRDTGKWLVSLEDFRRLLDVPKSYNLSKLNEKVLKPIQEELPTHFDNFRIVKKHGKGRGKPIIGFEFHFDPQEDLFTADERKEIFEHGKPAAEERATYKPTGIICPICSQELYEKEIQGGIRWCHIDGWKEDAPCRVIFNSIAEIKGYSEMPGRVDESVAENQKENIDAVSEALRDMLGVTEDRPAPEEQKPPEKKVFFWRRKPKKD